MRIRRALVPLWCAMLLGSGCIFPWDDYDPALSGGANAGGAGAAQSTGGNGATSGGGAPSTMQTSTNTGTSTTTSSMGGGDPGTCGMPYPITDASTTQGDNTGKADLISPTCMPGGEDQVYSVTASIDGVLVIDVPSVSDIGIIVRTICDDAGTEATCVDNTGGDDSEHASVLVSQGQTVFVIIDAYETGDVGPYTVTTSVHPLQCGDSIVDPSEDCDPPDWVTCSANCTGLPEVCDDGVDNDQDGATDCEDAGDCSGSCPLASDCAGATPLATTNNGDTSSSSSDFAGYCVGNELAPEDLYTYSASATGALLLTLSSGADLGIYARSDCEDRDSQHICIDQQGGGEDEQIAMPVDDGDFFTVFVDGYAGQSGPYTLTTTFVPSDEDEPNDSPVQADPYTSPFTANIYPSDDEDWVKVNVPAGGSLTAEVLGLVAPSCLQLIDSGLEIYDVDGTTLLGEDDDGGEGGCSLLSLSGLSGGTYFVRVVGYNAPFSYALDLQVN